MTTITKKAMQRRTFLRGLGATVALPFLDAMTPALTAATSARRSASPGSTFPMASTCGIGSFPILVRSPNCPPFFNRSIRSRAKF